MESNGSDAENSRMFIVTLEGFSLYYMAGSHEIVSLMDAEPLDSCGPDAPKSHSAQNN